jgi:hypothetical protein
MPSRRYSLSDFSDFIFVFMLYEIGAGVVAATGVTDASGGLM